MNHPVRQWALLTLILVLPALAGTYRAAAQQHGSSDASVKRNAFLRLLDRPPVPLASRVKVLSDAPTVREHFTYDSERGQTVRGVLRKPRSLQGRAAAVILYSDFDAPAMLPLIAPRPLLIINGDSDPRTPVPGVQQSAAPAEARYRALGAEERFRLLLQPNTGHAFTDSAQTEAVKWLVRWLAAGTSRAEGGQGIGDDGRPAL
jgi:dipeptidyl aminopeptidase/acylaminoacyl peptidase